MLHFDQFDRLSIYELMCQKICKLTAQHAHLF